MAGYLLAPLYGLDLKPVKGNQQHARAEAAACPQLLGE